MINVEKCSLSTAHHLGLEARWIQNSSLLMDLSVIGLSGSLVKSEVIDIKF